MSLKRDRSSSTEEPPAAADDDDEGGAVSEAAVAAADVEDGEKDAAAGDANDAARSGTRDVDDVGEEEDGEEYARLRSGEAPVLECARTYEDVVVDVSSSPSSAWRPLPPADAVVVVVGGETIRTTTEAGSCGFAAATVVEFPANCCCSCCRG